MKKIVLTGSLKERNEEQARLVNISEEDIKKAEKVLIDNGIDKDEADTVLQALGYTLLGVELYPNIISHSDNPFIVLEFKDNFTIQFSFRGATHAFQILLSEVEKDWENNKWHYIINTIDGFHFNVFGTLDNYGIVRTTGSCYTKDGVLPACFGINAFQDGDDDFETIDDIDIIAVDTV